MVSQGKRKPNSIRYRMMLSYLIITVCGFGIVFFWITQIVESFIEKQRRDEQEAMLYKITQKLTPEYLRNDGEALYETALEYSDSNRILVLNAQGVVVMDTEAGNESILGTRLTIYDEIKSVLWDYKYSDYSFYISEKELSEDIEWYNKIWYKISPPREWWVQWVQAIEDEGETVGAIMLSSRFKDVMEKVDDIRAQMAVTITVVVASMMIGSYLIARSITEPVAELTHVIRRMGRGEFNLRVKATGNTELAELSRTFNDMSERIENTERFRSEFVSNASHEIKTPLATMKILIESLLYQDKFDENITREFLSDINKEIDRLNVVVVDLLHLVQVDKREGDLRRENCDIKDICEDTIHRLKPISQKRNITLHSKLESASVNVDPIKIQQAIFNLVDNAIKYSDDHGNVEVTSKKEGQFAVIRISDDGIGIPKADQQHIFDRFYRVDKARSRQTGGTGLGLSIVDGVIKLHGGRIDLQSEEGKGSTFTVYLPIEGKSRSERG